MGAQVGGDEDDSIPLVLTVSADDFAGSVALLVAQTRTALAVDPDLEVCAGRAWRVGAWGRGAHTQGGGLPQARLGVERTAALRAALDSYETNPFAFASVRGPMPPLLHIHIHMHTPPVPLCWLSLR
jgi:hypothetical protein